MKSKSMKPHSGTPKMKKGGGSHSAKVKVMQKEKQAMSKRTKPNDYK